MNRTQTALKIREQFDGFMGILYPNFSKPMCKFLNQMVFGLQSARDIKLSNVARTLDEPIALKKTEERLSRNLNLSQRSWKKHRRKIGIGWILF